MFARARMKTWTLGAAALIAAAGVVEGQQSAVVAPAPIGRPGVNDVAPGFALSGATRYGLLQTPVRLSDYRGRTVVLAFFYQARTKG